MAADRYADVKQAVDDMYSALRRARDERSEANITQLLMCAGRLKEMGFNPIVFKGWFGVEAVREEAPSAGPSTVQSHQVAEPPSTGAVPPTGKLQV